MISAPRLCLPWRRLEGKVRLRLSLDRGSIEIFGNAGRVALSRGIQPEVNNHTLQLTCQGGPARIVELEVNEMNTR